MSLPKKLESWRNVTGIGHGNTWCTSPAALPPRRYETIPSSPWSKNSSLDTSVTSKRADTITDAKMNAAAPAFVPGQVEHTGQD
jgi:hypothetical protein